MDVEQPAQAAHLHPHAGVAGRVEIRALAQHVLRDGGAVEAVGAALDRLGHQVGEQVAVAPRAREGLAVRDAGERVPGSIAIDATARVRAAGRVLIGLMPIG